MKTVEQGIRDFIAQFPAGDPEMIAGASENRDAVMGKIKDVTLVFKETIKSLEAADVATATAGVVAWDASNPGSVIQEGMLLQMVRKAAEKADSAQSFVDFVTGVPGMLDRPIDFVSKGWTQHAVDKLRRETLTTEKMICSDFIVNSIMNKSQERYRGSGNEMVAKRDLEILGVIAGLPWVNNLQPVLQSFMYKAFFDSDRKDDFEAMVNRGVSLNQDSHLHEGLFLVNEIMRDSYSVKRNEMEDLLQAVLGGALPGFTGKVNGMPVANGPRNDDAYFALMDGKVDLSRREPQGGDFPYAVSTAILLGRPNLVEWSLKQPDVPWEWLKSKNVDMAIMNGEKILELAKQNNGFVHSNVGHEERVFPSAEIRKVVGDWLVRNGKDPEGAVNLGHIEPIPLDLDFD